MTLAAPARGMRGFGVDPSLMPDSYGPIHLTPPPPGIGYRPPSTGGGYAPTSPSTDVLIPTEPPPPVNGGAGRPPNGRRTETPPTTPPPEDKSGVKAWWAARSKVEKGAIAVGGVASVGLIVWAITR